MDKFGIFNLLNSFFPLIAQKTEQTTNNLSPSTDILSNLLSSFTKTKTSNKTDETNKESKPLSAPHHLQEQMLLTVSNHDAFVKRVRKNQNF